VAVLSVCAVQNLLKKTSVIQKQILNHNESIGYKFTGSTSINRAASQMYAYGYEILHSYRMVEKP
jgi:hypothetical protein